MTFTSLSHTVKQTCDKLRQGATSQVMDYEQRFSGLKNLYNDLLAGILKASYSVEEAWNTASQFFGSETVRFAAVDGTMYSRPLFDMVIFFGGAYASTGTVTFHKDSSPSVVYDARTLQQGMGISSVVPMYINEVPDVDQTFFSTQEPGELKPNKPLTDEGVANNATIANSIMTFAEYYLAYKFAAEAGSKETKIILLDRSLSTERASLLYDTGQTDLWRIKSSLLGYAADGVPIDVNDLTIARQHVYNERLGLPAPRADYLRHALIDLAKRRGSFSIEQARAEFGIADGKRTRRIELSLRSLVKNGVFNEKNGVYSLSQRYVSSWERIRSITLELGDAMFYKEPSETAGGMKIVKDGKERWLTTLDTGFLTLFALQMLMEECWKKRILLVGVTKDTAARDFKRQLVPIMHGEGLLETRLDREALNALPNTDRMILQSASIFNLEQIKPPWSLIEYDSAFRTMLPDKENRKGYVSGAIRNKIGLEKAFLKTYVQLSVAKSDPMLRSNVLLIDRLVYPEYDYKPESTVKFQNELSNGAEEPVEVLLFKDKDVPNKMQNVVMTLLFSMAPANIPEAFGHNKALFVADRVAKWNYGQFKRVVDTTAIWILNNHKLRKFVFYMSTFRERRASIEQARRDNI